MRAVAVVAVLAVGAALWVSEAGSAVDASAAEAQQVAGLVLSTVVPCAVFDTRPGRGGMGAQIQPDVDYAFSTREDLGGQGGVAAGCGVPADAVAVALNLVAINPAGTPGNLRMWSADDALPEGGVVNFIAGGQNSNAIVVGVSGDDASRVNVRANGHAVHVRGVVLGFYTPETVEAGGGIACADGGMVLAIRDDGTPLCSLEVVGGVSAGGSHSCAALDDGTAWCWGAGGSGQLGDGAGVTRTRAVQVTRLSDSQALTGVAAVSAGNNHSCAALDDGTAWCWGNGGDGRLGEGDTVNRTRAVQVTRQSDGQALTGVAAVSAGGSHSCAALDDGTAWCWGNGGNGRLGEGDTVDRTRAVQVTRLSDGQALTGAASVAAGTTHSCAALADGTAWCWGNGSNGRLGEGATIDRTRAVQVTRQSDSQALTGAAAVAAGTFHSCAALADGTAWCWGAGGRLGDGDTVERTRAVQVTRQSDSQALTGVAGVSAGSFHSCAAGVDGTAWCWGAGGDGQLGEGDTVNRTRAVQVTRQSDSQALTGVAAVSAGSSHSCAALADGTAWCWGAGDFGQLGEGDTVGRTRAVQVTRLTG